MSVLVYDCGSVENTVTAILDTESGAMIIRGNGDVDNYADEYSPWYSEHSNITQVTVDKGITRIGSGTFYGCENLSFVEIANTVTSMGADVFQNCTSLTSIKIPKSITAIGNGTFADSGLTEVKFYGNPPTVGTDIFDGVTADIYTPEGNEEWTETAKGTVAGNGSNLTWKTFDSKPNLIEYDELDYLWSKIKKYVDNNVSVTPVLTSGTKIATITVNGVDTDLYSSPFSGTIGDSTSPIYIDNGVPTACGGSLDVDITGNAATATSATNASNVLQKNATANYNRPLMLTGIQNTTTTTNANREVCYSNKFYANPSTGVLYSTGGFIGDVTGNCSGSSGSCTGNSATATTATNSTNSKLTHTVGNTEYPLVFGTSFVITDAQQALRIGTPTATAANCALRCKSYCAAANTQGEAYLVIGNNLAKASANNSRGGLYLYGTGTTWAYFRVGDQTANKTVTLVAPADVTLTMPSSTGTLALTSSDITGSSASCTGNAATATTASACSGNAASATYATNILVTSTQSNNYYYVVGTSGNTASVKYAPAVFPNILIRDDANSTSEVFSRLSLGNPTAKGTSGGKTGCLTLYGNNTKLCNLLGPEGASANINVRLPNSAGTLALTSSDITGNAATATSASACSGNAATATKLKTAVNLTISDGTNSGTATSFNGSAGVTLNLPTTIVATINGDITGNSNSTTNAKLYHTTATERPLVFGTSFTTNDSAQALRIATPTTTKENCPLRCLPGVAAANTQGEAYLVIGNNLAKASENNSRGSLIMYGTGTTYLRFLVGSTNTSNRNLTLNSNFTGNHTYTLPNGDGTLAFTSSNITGSASKWGGYAISVVSSLPASMDANTIYFLT